MDTTETHPLPPFLPPNAKILILGSFPPPPHRWKMNFYYPNFNNDMWRVFGMVFFGDKNRFIDSTRKTFKETALRTFLTEQGIALYDSAYRIKRLQGNAADKYLQIIEPVDLKNILSKIPHCRHIAATGGLAARTLLSLLPEHSGFPDSQTRLHTRPAERGLTLHRLPSTSRAYPLPLTDKAAAYADCFRQAGLLQAT